MIINEATLGELCARVARGDEQARRDFDRHVLPVVEAIAGRCLSQQRAKEIESGARGAESSLAQSSATGGLHLSPKVAGAICAQMVAHAARERRMHQRRQSASRRQKSAAGETLSALIERHTVSRLVPWPA